ncbi:MAG: hypothetical protein GY760_17130 [Deltaproteobacteria bacterium]|nr:hypothetical protein [Deltaproteobacteria bacterium]
MLKRILLMASLIGTLLLSNGFAEETMRLAIGKWDPYQSEHLKYYGGFKDCHGSFCFRRGKGEIWIFSLGTVI